MKDQSNNQALTVAREAIGQQAYQVFLSQIAEDPDRYGRMIDAIMYAYCIASTNPRMDMPNAYKESFLDYLNLMADLEKIQVQIQKLENCGR